MIGESYSGSGRRGLRLFAFAGGSGLVAVCVTLGMFASTPAQALALPGLLGGIVCRVPLNVCVRLVTHAQIGDTEIVREHALIPAIGPLSILPGQAVDVTGDGRADLAVTLAVPATLLPPGYDADKPTLKVVKLAGAPALLPVKVEAVTDSAAGGKLSFGYDSRTASAPQSFVARIDLSNRDGLADTSQARVDLNISAGNSTGVALVTESFTAGGGLGESQRTDRDVTQIGYRAVAALGTQVPASARIDFTSGPGMQHVVLTRSHPTTAEVLLDKPDHDPRISGRIDRLPATVDLTIVDEDIDDDGSSDRLSFDYAGSEVVPEAQLIFELLTRDPSGDHRPVFTVTAEDLPTVAHFDYDLDDDALALDTSARTRSIVLTGTDSVPFFESARGFVLRLEDLPRALDAGFGAGRVTLDAYADSQRQQRNNLAVLDFRGQGDPSAPIPVPDCGTALCDDGYDVLRDGARNGAIREDLPGHYLLLARIHKLKSAAIVTEPDTDILVDTAPDLGPPGSACGEFPPPDCDARTESWRPLEVLILKERIDDDPLTGPVTTIRARLNALLPDTHFVQSHDDAGTPDDKNDDIDTIAYGNAVPFSSVDILVEAENLPGPAGKNGQNADRLRADLGGAPSSLQFTYAGDGFPLKLRTTDAGAGLRRLDVLLSSADVTDADLLPKTETVDYNFTPGNSADDEPRFLDGVRIRDYPDRYAIHARIDWLRSFTVDKGASGGVDTPCIAGDELCIALDIGQTGLHPRLRFDSETKISQTFGQLTLPGVTTVFATLDQLPATLFLRKYAGADGETRLDYQAASAVGVLGDSERKGFQLTQTTNYENPAPDPILPNSFNDVSFAPMPQTLALCRSDDTRICSDSAFGDRTDAGIGSLGLTAGPRTRFRYFDQPNTQAQVYTLADITADLFRFQADADGAGYLAFDTGWDSVALRSPPPAARIGKSVIKQVNGTRDITEFTFGDSFAADGRMIAWSSQEILFAADTTDITSLLDRSGRVVCTPQTDLVLHRVGPGGIDLTLNLTNELCE